MSISVIFNEFCWSSKAAVGDWEQGPKPFTALGKTNLICILLVFNVYLATPRDQIACFSQ